MCSGGGGSSGSGGGPTGNINVADEINKANAPVIARVGPDGVIPGGTPGTDNNITGQQTTRVRTSTGSGIGGVGQSATGDSSTRSNRGAGLRM